MKKAWAPTLENLKDVLGNFTRSIRLAKDAESRQKDGSFLQCDTSLLKGWDGRLIFEALSKKKGKGYQWTSEK